MLHTEWLSVPSSPSGNANYSRTCTLTFHKFPILPYYFLKCYLPGSEYYSPLLKICDYWLKSVPLGIVSSFHIHSLIHVFIIQQICTECVPSTRRLMAGSCLIGFGLGDK